jgi:hypothetical protein
LKKWLADHVFDVLITILTIIGLWIAYQIPISLNRQDSAERVNAEKTARFEADTGLVNQTIGGALGEELDQETRYRVTAKRSAARALSDYAQQGRIYPPSTSILLHYLEREDDPETHCFLRLAVDRGLNVKPPAVGVGARTAEGSELNDSTWSKTVATERARLQALIKKSDQTDCLAAQANSSPLPQPMATVYRQNFNVDCGGGNSNTLHVPLESTLSNDYTVQSARATIEDTSNLQSANAQVVSQQADGVDVQYSYRGLNRELFGNCPGGGHGTLVVQFQLSPKMPKD